MSPPTTIQGSRQTGTATRATTGGSGPHHCSRAAPSQAGRSHPRTRSKRSSKVATASGTVLISLTWTWIPASRRRRTSSSRFSSLTASTTSGARARTAARSGFLVPRTRVTSRSAGWVHHSVAPTTRSGATEASASVNEGTSETTRCAGWAWAVPAVGRGVIGPS